MGILKSEVQGVISRLWVRGRTYKVAVTKSMKVAAIHLMHKSKELVPIDTGALINSAKVTVHEKGLESEVNLSYGDENAYYAIFVHEDLTKVHGAAFNAKYAMEIALGREHSRRPQEQAKFLEEPLADLTEVKAVFNKSLTFR